MIEKYELKNMKPTRSDFEKLTVWAQAKGHFDDYDKKLFVLMNINIMSQFDQETLTSENSCIKVGTSPISSPFSEIPHCHGSASSDLDICDINCPHEQAGHQESPNISQRLSIDLGALNIVDESTTKASPEAKFQDQSGPLTASDLGLDPIELNVFVLSDAGKPIYSRFGDETKLAHLMGVMQALVSVVAQNNDQLHTLITFDKKIVFKTCGHLILVAVGPSQEPTSHLCIVLKYVYSQIISALTLQRIEKWFTQKHNLDLRNLLIGDSRILSGVIELIETQFGPTLNSVLCIPLSNTVRETVVQAITQGVRSHDLVFAILLSNCRLVCIVSMKKHFLHPMDIHLITNLVGCSESFKASSTNWLPICLPKFNPNGYLYANLSYLDKNSCLVLLTVDSNQFYELQQSRDQILSRLQSSMHGDCLSIIASAACIPVSAVSISELRHFVCKMIPAAQYTTCRWSSPYVAPPPTPELLADENSVYVHRVAAKARRRAVLCAYRSLHKKMHCEFHPVSSVYQASDTEVYLGSKTVEYEIYMTLEPFVDKQEAFDILKRLTKWISGKKQRLFILSSPTF